MAILEIQKYNNPVLRKKAEEIFSIDTNLKNLINDMFQTVESAKGIGLAAPQIGKSIRIIVVNVVIDEKKISFPLINPEIIQKSGRFFMEEGCLSLPEIRENVKRSLKITVIYRDAEFNKLEIKAEGLLARILQHEIDHLNGILFIDRLEFFKRKKVLRQIRKIIGK